MRRAVFYLRLSATDDASTSITRQRQDLDELASREGWEPIAVLTDDGISGRKARANAAEALRMLRDGEADVLVVWKFDRWSRQGLGAVADLVATLDTVPGALFVALRDGLRSDQPAWRIIASVLAEVARMEADNTAMRVKSSIRELKRTGRYSGGRVPFGYAPAPAPDGPGRILKPSPHEAAVVREFAERILDGESLLRVVRDLNGRQVPTVMSPARKAALAGLPATGLDTGLWRISTIRSLYTSDHLLGRVTQNGSLRTDSNGLPVRVWEPILDLATMTRLRARLGDPRTRVGKPRRRAARLLSGVAFCAHCGRKMYVRTSSGRAVYGCSALNDSAECVNPRIDAERLEDFVSETFLRIAGAAPETEEVELVTDPGTSESLAEVETTLQATTAALMLDDADVPALMARVEALKARRAELRSLPSSIAVETVPTGRTIREAWDAGDVEHRRRTLLSQLDHVLVTGAIRRGSKFDTDRVTLHWNALVEA